MFQPVSVFVGLRYLRARRRQSEFISLISLISLLGIALGVAALIVVLSVMNGFSEELRSRLLSLSSHATVQARDGQLREWAYIAERSEQQPEVSGAAPFVAGEGMLVNGARLAGVLVDGVLPVGDEPDGHDGVSLISERMLEGSVADLRPGARNLVLGVGLAQSLGVSVGDRVNMLVPRAERGRFVPQISRFTVSGLFEAGIQEHDNMRAVANIEDAAELFGLQGGVSGVRLRLHDLMQAPRFSRQLQDALGEAYKVEDWAVQQASYFRAIRIEKLMMFVILSLIVAVAAFNIVATLVMAVADKRNDIAILRTLGMTPRAVQMAFVFQGLAIGFIGTVSGVALGVLVALNVETLVPRIEALLGIKLIPADVYYVTQIPSRMHWEEVVGIAITAFALSAFSTIYPARRAAATQPAEALRYE